MLSQVDAVTKKIFIVRPQPKPAEAEAATLAAPRVLETRDTGALELEPQWSAIIDAATD